MDEFVKLTDLLFTSAQHSCRCDKVENADIITDTINTYLETKEVEEDDLAVLMQMDYDDEENDFRIDYTITNSRDEDPMTIATGFSYDNLAEAWENYLDQVAEIDQTFQDAEVRAASPEDYEGGKIGGNPVMSIRDAGGEL